MHIFSLEILLSVNTGVAANPVLQIHKAQEHVDIWQVPWRICQRLCSCRSLGSTGRANTPFDQEFFLILNVAVGGTNGWFPYVQAMTEILQVERQKFTDLRRVLVMLLVGNLGRIAVRHRCGTSGGLIRLGSLAGVRRRTEV